MLQSLARSDQRQAPVWTETSNVVGAVRDKMQLDLPDDLCRINDAKSVNDIRNGDFEIVLVMYNEQGSFESGLV